MKSEAEYRAYRDRELHSHVRAHPFRLPATLQFLFVLAFVCVTYGIYLLVENRLFDQLVLLITHSLLLPVLPVQLAGAGSCIAGMNMLARSEIPWHKRSTDWIIGRTIAWLFAISSLLAVAI